MIGISIKALETVDSTTGTAMNDAREVNIDASDAAMTTANSAFDETGSTVASSFATIEGGASRVASGIDGACDTLDDWAPLINTANDVGNFFSSFRRLRDEEEKSDASQPSSDWMYLLRNKPP
jgi:hypothetical protein